MPAAGFACRVTGCSLSNHRRTTFRNLTSPVRASLCLIFGVFLVGICSWISCAQDGVGHSGWQREQSTFPAGGAPVVVALGNFRGSPPPTKRETELSVFLFGVEPEAPLGLSKPRAVAVDGERLLICDSGVGAVFDADTKAGTLGELRLGDGAMRPAALNVLPDGNRLVVDLASNSVIRFDAQGRVVTRYRRDGVEFRPADCLEVRGDVWVTNVAAHEIDVFDADSGAFKRAIGSRGAGRGQFGMPLGMAKSPNGDVYVVDSLNGRVQVFDSGGTWKRHIGKPGNRAGCFGRIKDVAVGPDGVVFVVDAASQRVHVFDSSGRVLLTFGEPGSGSGSLAMPNGIAVSQAWQADRGSLPGSFEPAYAVFVAEQLNRPGVRVYAWGRGVDNRIANAGRTSSSARSSHRISASVVNPHWAADRCSACHSADGGRAPRRIAAERVNDICLECHDGRKAHAEPHPIGRKATTDHVTLPSGWPTVDGRIACLTCHDVQRHCEASASRPAVNPAMLRHHEPEDPMSLCMQCHQADDSWRISPHNQIDDSGTLNQDSCLFCHTTSVSSSAGATPSARPTLRTDAERVCMSCHTKHWDYFPEGHVERLMPPAMLTAIQSGDGGASSRLPLHQNRVMCYTCHNPHAPGVFPANHVAGSYATAPADAKVQLRMNRSDLCIACHPK